MSIGKASALPSEKMAEVAAPHVAVRGKVTAREALAMVSRAAVSAGEHPQWKGLLDAFLGLLDREGPRASGDQVCELFLADRWFQDLLDQRTRQAVERRAVPRNCRDDLEQTILLLFVQKARKAPNLHVKREVAKEHFGGWIWSIVDDLCLQAARRIRRHYRFESGLVEEVENRSKQRLDQQVDVKLLVAELPVLTRTILSLFDEGYKLVEIADIVGEKYWKVSELHRGAVAYIRGRLVE